MKVFNAIQIAALIAAGPILIPMLATATFFAATQLMWLLALIWCILFIWNVLMIADSR